MDYHTPGVYIREVDSGPKPIASVSTSIPGFLGLFEFKPAHDAVAVTGTNGKKVLRGKVVPQLVDEKGNIKGDGSEATTALAQAFRLNRAAVRDVKKYFELHGAAKSGVNAPKFEPGGKGKTKVSWQEKHAEFSETILSVDGKVVTETDQLVEDMLNKLHESFPLDKAQPKTAADVLGAYGYEVKSTEGTALRSEYSVAPVALTNKAEFFRWLQSYFAQFLCETRSIEELVGRTFESADDACDAVFEALNSDEALKVEFRNWLSTPSLFSFVAGVNGFYDNGGGKCYVYLMGAGDTSCSIRENQADKLGLYAFDDVDDMALMVAPGLMRHQQQEMLEMCEVRKDRFAILDGPIVSDGSMDIPASNKGYGALYVPWVKITKPSWYTGDQDTSRSPVRTGASSSSASATSCSCRRPATWRACTRAWTGSVACTRRRRTRSAWASPACRRTSTGWSRASTTTAAST